MTRPPLVPDWCSEVTMAALLDMAPSTFRDYVARGLLPKGIKVGGSRRWSRASVNDALERLTVQSNDGDPIMAAIRGDANGPAQGSQRDAA
jgi:predicted DNA-binding transcriptional regulator AlpA